jgi:hypothetical protein
LAEWLLKIRNKGMTDLQIVDYKVNNILNILQFFINLFIVFCDNLKE